MKPGPSSATEKTCPLTARAIRTSAEWPPHVVGRVSMVDRAELRHRASEYCQRAGLQLGPQLGYGVHGTVFTALHQTDPDPSAVKVHERERFYRRERDVYRRLAEEG